ncbi:hypothetical protein H2200_006793 [Cladophialophora chaetospira]|uniref:Uncharacterized protein n=1 Tax=Cladophialophora chaetospira TaxID=386627 RepID=A0AA38X904_9EURO|nr:hypothetical protein H2200_006793 [Cladophialophora chaetospira]
MLRDAFDDGLPPRPVPAPWTASRCNRTLRKLTTFVAKIEKWHQAFLVASEAPADGEELKIESPNQLSWLAQATSRKSQKSRKKYTTHRKTIPHTPAPKPLPKTRSAGATPHNNSLHVLADTRCDAKKFNVHKNTKIALVEDTTRAPPVSHSCTTATAHLADDYDAISRDGWSVIPAFLVATSDPDRASSFDPCSEDNSFKPGARSLVDMCLASLSREMIKQQKENDTNRNGYDGQLDIIGSHLNELEDYFGDSRSGWRPLRSVIRICGISMIAQLITTGALTEETAINLGMRWRHRPFLWDFSDAVQDALIASGFRPAALDTGFVHLPGMGELEEEGGRLRHPWKSQLTHRWALRALKTNEDPISILASGIRYNHLALCITLSNTNSDLADSGNELLGAVYRAALAHGQTYNHEDLRRTLSSPYPVVHSQQQCIQHTDLDERLWQRLKIILYLALYHSQDNPVLVELGHDQRLSATQQTLIAEIFLVHLCHLLMRDTNIPRDLLRSFELLLCSIEARKSLSGQLAGTITACFDKDLEGLQRLVGKLLAINYHDFETLHTLILQIVSDAAMENVAEGSDSPETLSWATGIHETTRERLTGLLAHRPGSPMAKLRTGYRWDDGIEEWLVKTPATVTIMDGTCNKTTVCLPQLDSGASQLDLLGKDTVVLPNSTDSSSPTAARSRNSRNASQRKRPACDFEIHVDGDFMYKKARRKKVPEQGCSGFKFRRQDRENWSFEDISGDELSLIE